MDTLLGPQLAFVWVKSGIRTCDLSQGNSMAILFRRLLLVTVPAALAMVYLVAMYGLLERL